MSETAKFVKGTIVRLNSGGPKMTALSDAEADQVLCQWFDRNGKMHKAEFDTSALSKFKKAW